MGRRILHAVCDCTVVISLWRNPVRTTGLVCHHIRPCCHRRRGSRCEKGEAYGTVRILAQSGHCHDGSHRSQRYPNGTCDRSQALCESGGRPQQGHDRSTRCGTIIRWSWCQHRPWSCSGVCRRCLHDSGTYFRLAIGHDVLLDSGMQNEHRNERFAWFRLPLLVRVGVVSLHRSDYPLNGFWNCSPWFVSLFRHDHFIL